MKNTMYKYADRETISHCNYLLNEQKQKIIEIIAKAFAQESFLSEEEVEANVKGKLNDCQTFIVGVKGEVLSPYEKRVDAFKEKIASFFDIDKDKLLSNHLDAQSIQIQNVKDLQIVIDYKKNIKKYAYLGIDFDCFQNAYEKNGSENILGAVEYIDRLLREISLYDIKSKISSNHQNLSKKKKIKSMEYYLAKYHLNDLSEAIDMKRELMAAMYSFLPIVDENQKKLAKELYDSLRRRLSLDPNYTFTYQQIDSMIKDLNKGFYNIYYDKLVVDSNLKDCIVDLNIDKSSENISFLLDVYDEIINKNYLNASNNDNKYVFFNEHILKNNIIGQNKLIFKAYISSFENKGNHLKGAFNDSLNEFLARKCSLLFNEELVAIHGEDKSDSDLYDESLVLVNVLRNSYFWKDIVLCKLCDDYSSLEKRLGIININNISNIFEKVINGSVDLESAKDELAKVIAVSERKYKTSKML